VGSNWSTGQVPGANDDVVIDQSDINIVQRTNAPFAVHRLTSNANLYFDANSFTIGADSILNGLFSVSGATILGRADLTVNGEFQLFGGTLGGTGRLEAHGGISLRGVGNATVSGRTIDNFGQATWMTNFNETVTFTNNAVFKTAGATFTVQAGGNATLTLAGTGTLNNAGTFQTMDMDPTGGTTTLGITLHNTGTVEAVSGTLNMTSNRSSTGVFTADAGATLNFTGGTHVLAVGSSVGGAGTVLFSSSSIVILGSYTASTGLTISSGTTTFNADITLPTLTITGGTLTGFGNVTVTGLLTWTAGSITGPGQTTAAGGMAISGNNDKALDGRTLNNAGAATMTGNGNIVLVNNGVFNNLATGTFNLQSDAAVRTYSIFTTPGMFNNAGLFQKSGGTGYSYMSQDAFNNSGTVVVSSGILDLAGGGLSSGAFVTNAGGTLEFGAGYHILTADSSISGDGNVLFDSETFTNFSMVDDGSFNVSGTTTLQATNQPFAYPYVQFDQDVIMGALNLSAGVEGDYSVGSLVVEGNLTVNGLLSWTAGHMTGGGHTIANGGIVISGNAIKTLDGRFLDNAGTATWSNAGGITLDSGAIWNNLPGGTFAGNFTISSGTFVFGTDTTLPTLTLAGGALGGTSTVTVTGLLSWTGGTMNGGGRTVANGGISLLGVDKGLDHRTLDNAGTATWIGTGNIGLDGFSVWNNLPGATFLAQNDATFGGGTFNNAGTLQKMGSTGTTTFSTFLNNTGTVDVARGTLALAGGGTNSAAYTVEMGATLAFAGGNQYLTPSSSLSGPGNVLFSGANVEMLGSYRINGALTVSNGTLSFDTDIALAGLTLTGGTLTGAGDVAVNGLLTWLGGTMSGVGSTDANGGMAISGNNKTLDTRTLNNAGNATWTGTGVIAFNNGALWNNLAGAVLDLQTTAGASGSGTFDNQGTVQKLTGTGTAGLGVLFINEGSVDIEAGRLTVSNGFTNTGSVTIGPGATLDVPTHTYSENGGTTMLSGGVLNAGTVDVEGGILSGPGTINGNVLNNGQLHVGGAGVTGILTINGTYTQRPGGTLVIQVGGSTPGTGFDKIAVSGQATLDGSLTVILLDGFVPGPLQIVTFQSHTGTFATLDGDGPLYTASYAPGSLTLT
jgi:hypothetical protein